MPYPDGRGGAFAYSQADGYRLGLEQRRLMQQAAESAASRAAMLAFDTSLYGYGCGWVQPSPAYAAAPQPRSAVAAPVASSPGAANFIDSVRWTYRSTPIVYATLVQHLDAFQRKEMGPETLVRNILSLLREAPDTLLLQLSGFVPAHLRFLVENALRPRHEA